MSTAQTLDDPRALASTLLRQRRPGYSLEAPFYRDPGIFELDFESRSDAFR
jgi:Rieske 2Fe-2S family protein